MTQADPPQPADRIRVAATELALALGSMLLVGVVAITVGRLGLLPTQGYAARAGVFVLGPLVTAVAALIYRAGAQALEPLQLPAWSRHSLPITLAFVLGGVVSAVTGSFLIGQVMDLLGQPVQEQADILAIIGEGTSFELIALSVSAVLLAPIAEEALFRGLLFRRLATTGLPEAYLLSALVFALIHANPAGFIVYVWLGCVFAATYRATGQLWTAMAVHMGNNTIALAGLLLSAR